MMNFKPLLTLVPLLIMDFVVQAQKLPNVQENSFRAPVAIQIDGKPTEWGDKFQAYNHATDIFYTIANDDDDLYLVIQAVDPSIITRITSRGITFSIQRGTLKDDKNQASITYPVSKTPPYLGLNRKKYALTDTSIKAADSVMRRYNRLIDDSCRFIGVNGIKGIDTLISVYNRDGIKARGQFDNKKVFTCEFSIKLKLLNVSVRDNANLAYKIWVNGYKTSPITILPPSNPSPEQEANYERQIQVLNKFIAPTYFQGEYTLTKK